MKSVRNWLLARLGAEELAKENAELRAALRRYSRMVWRLRSGPLE